MIATLSTVLLTLISGGSIAWAMLSVRRFRSRELQLQDAMAAMQRELEILATMTSKGSQQVRRVERTYAGMADRIGQLELRGEGRPYAQAIDWARRGADRSRLARQFGLSRGEADLVTRLHGIRRNA